MVDTENSKKIKSSLDKFLSWLHNYGFESNDKDDLLDSDFGLFTKRLFYKNKFLGAPFAITLLIGETFFPQIIKHLSSKRREAIADAHYALGYLNLYSTLGDKDFLKRAESLLYHLKSNAISGFSGPCWGYTKGWQTAEGLWPAGTPCITVTPYVYWAFREHYNITKEKDSLEMCRSISKFVLNDLKLIQMPNKTFSAQYSTLDNNGSVINSTAYRAALLYDSGLLFSNDDSIKQAELNIDFILSYQNNDGSWPYMAIDSKSAMIDNFHSCIVLNNLYKLYKLTNDKRIFNSIDVGYRYYRKKLIYPNGRPKHASKRVLQKMRKYEMYDYAEGILLNLILSHENEVAKNHAKFLVMDLIDNFQTKRGHFITRVTPLNTKHSVPYHRWPQSQLFYSLTCALATS